jgi:small conductance mechanosensitive channel
MSDDLLSTLSSWLQASGIPIAAAILTLVIGWYLSRAASRLIRRLLPLAYGVDRNFAPILSQAARYGIIVFAAVTALSFLGVPIASIYAVLGAAGLAIALALQNTLANIAAGIMLVWLRPIAIGEYIVGDGVAGIVVEIGLFGTRLRSTSGLYIFTPNLKLWNGAITNHSREPRRRIDVNVSIPDTADVGAARRAVLEVVSTDSRVLPDPPATVHVETFVGDRIVLQLRAWVPTPTYLDALRDITERAKAALNRQLAGSAQHAEVVAAADPHTLMKAEQTPSLS